MIDSEPRFRRNPHEDSVPSSMRNPLIDSEPTSRINPSRIERAGPNENTVSS